MKTKLLRKIRAKVTWKFGQTYSWGTKIYLINKDDLQECEFRMLYIDDVILHCLTLIGKRNLFISNKQRKLNRLTKAQKNKKIQDWLNS